MYTVVIVDDELHNAEGMAFMLASEGWRVLTACDGAEGLRLVSNERPQAVITDFMMPVMTGLEMAYALRQNESLANIPIILVTAAQAEIGRSHPHLFDAVFTKPCHLDALIATIKDFLISGRS